MKPEITAEIQRAWVMVQGAPPDWLIDTLATGLRDQLAARRRAEWTDFHRIRCPYKCKDERHNYQWPDWQAAADRELTKE